MVAAAMELSTEIGSLEIGKRANFLVLPAEFSMASIAYHFGHNLIESVYINGKKRI